MRIHDGEHILEIMRAYQVPCLLAAAVDLDLFEKLAPAPRRDALDCAGSRAIDYP